MKAIHGLPASGGQVHAAKPAGPLPVVSVSGGCRHDAEGQEKILVARSGRATGSA